MTKGPQPSRAHKRYDVDWRVSLKCPDWHLAGSVAAANASRGGLFLLTTPSPPVGAIVELGVELPDGTRLSLRGTVQHVVTPERAAATGDAPGFGVKFLEEHETDLVLLEQMAAAAHPPKPKTIPPSPSPSPPSSSTSPPPPPVDTATGPVIGQIAVKRRVVTTQGEEVAPIVGIDLGVSYASICGAVGGRLFAISDVSERTRHPCLVHMPEQGPALVGWEARERMTSRPRATVVGPRRLLGRTIDDPALSVHLAATLVRIVPAPDRTARVEIDGILYDAERLTAQIFTHLGALAERELGHPITQAVVAVPTHFDEARAEALRRAAARGGFEVVALVPDPVCAARASLTDATRGALVVVFDLGATTCTVSLLEGTGDGFELLASSWEDRLGGDELDLRVAQAVADAFWRSTALEVRTDLGAWLRLLLATEEAKRRLSADPDAILVVERLVAEPERYDLHQRIDRDFLDRVGTEVVQRCLGVCRLLLDSASVRPAELSAVVLAGGCTRVPLIRAAVSHLFGIEPVSHAQPDEVICLGAGLHGARLIKHRVTAVG